MYSAWDKRSKKAKYAHFFDALNAATAKLNDYYTKTAASDAHILAMSLCFFLYYEIVANNLALVLHPGKKMAHFKKYWEVSLQKDVIELVLNKVCYLGPLYHIIC